MHRTLAVIAALVLLAPASSAGDDRAFAPDGLNPLNAEAEYRIPHGRPLLFCGGKFITLLVVAIFHEEVEGQVINMAEPYLNAYRKSDITKVALSSQSGARVFFKDGVLGESYFAVDTWTDARAIMECLN
jgi:hypothetical protein